MSNPGGVNLNVSPYYDDYDEDKKYSRILFRPGRAVQARELTQLQTIFQKQIQRFGNYFFKEGSIIDGCEQGLDLNLSYAKLQPTYNGNQIDVDNFNGKNVIGSETGIKVKVGLVSDIEGNDPKTLFINYASSGTMILSVNAVPSTIVSGNTISTANASGRIEYWNDSIFKIYISNITGTFVPTNATTVSSNGSTLTVQINTVTDKRTSKVLEDDEIIFTDEASPVYANTAILQATSHTENDVTYTKGSKVSVGDGVVYVADHFTKNTNQTIILDKYKNTPSYKVGFVPTKTFVDYIEDPSLVDNAQGTPNYQAPGADRFKIDTVLTKLELNAETSESEFITLIEVDGGSVKKRKSFGLESKLEEVIAKRTFEESGDYTLSNPKINIREHLLADNNAGRYTSAEGGNTNLLLLEVDPFVGYVKGFRNEFITRQSIQLNKGLDTQYIQQNKIQLAYGNYVEVNDVIGPWDLMESTKIDLYDTAFNAIAAGGFSLATSTAGKNKIGEARVRSIEYVSGSPGTVNATYRIYLFDIVMNSGKYFSDVRALYDAGTIQRIADTVLDSSGRAILQESAYSVGLFEFPYEAVKTIRDSNGNIVSGYTFKKEFQVTFTNGVATVSSGDNSENFVGSGVLSSSQKNINYTVVVNNSNTNVETTSLTGTVSAANNSTSVTGSGTNFTSQFNVGDYIKASGQTRRISTITSATALVVETAFSPAVTTAAMTKVIPAGAYVDLSGNGGSALSRVVTVSSPSTIQIDIKEPATFTASLIATMNKTSAREMQKLLQPNQQVFIQANTHPSGLSGSYSLGKSDVYKIRGIYQAANFVSVPTTANTDVTANYIFDNGQRDSTYEHGRITPKVGIVPTGRLLVVFDFFRHDTTQGVGYMSVDSYPVDDVGTSNTTIDTAEIPSYVSSSTGTKYELRNSIDLRIRKLDDSANTINPVDPGTYQIPIGGLHNTKPSSDFDSDVIIYKGRISRLFLNENGEFGIVDGSPGYPKPQVPPSVPGTLDLAIINVHPYPSSPVDVVIEPQKNRRYTMKDIGKIEDRINRLEYYTSLNLLEKQAADLSILDENGLDRFKNGLLVDPFTGYNIADVNNEYLKVSIDTKEKYVTAQASVGEIPLQYATTGSSGVTRTSGNKLMLNYTHEVFSENPYASSALNLSQELTYDWTGVMSILPSTDNWVDTTNNPLKNLVVVDLEGNADNWRTIANAWDTELNSWESRWVGTSVQQEVGSTKPTVARVVQQTQLGELIGSNITVGSTESQTPARVVDVSVNHFMRSRDFIFDVSGVKSNSRLYAFFDGIDVTANCTQITINSGYTTRDVFDLLDSNGTVSSNTTVYTVKSTGTMFADGEGKLVGIFTLPAQKFSVGQREFKLIDDAQNRDSVATTSTKNSIVAQGLSVISASNHVNTRPINVNFTSALEKSNISRQIKSPTNTFVRDPLSQSFFIDEVNYAYGVFVSKIDVYFKTKSANSSTKVYMQIREMENGFPTRKAIGDSTTFVRSGNITVSADGTTATTFTFDSPIYLLPGIDYCFSLIPEGNVDDFEIWTAELGALDVSSGDLQKRIEKQPAAGILFTSSNDFSWSVRQNQDLKYKIYVAKFAPSASGVVVLENKPIASSRTYSSFVPNIAALTPDKTGVVFNARVSDSSGLLTNYFNVNNIEKVNLPNRKSLLTSAQEVSAGVKSMNVRGTMSTQNEYITPFIDLERLQSVTLDYSINNTTSLTLTGTATVTAGSNTVVGSSTLFTSQVLAGEYISFGGVYRQVTAVTNNTSLIVGTAFSANASAVLITADNEENPKGPYVSGARYISRRVELVDGFEANDLTVYLDVNRPAGTAIKVYYKVLHETDSDSFDDKFYIEMSLDGSATFTSDSSAYTEEKYVVPTSVKSGGTLLLNGTVAVSNVSTTVTGSSTRFLEELKIGDTITVGTTSRIVSTVANNISMTVDSAFSTVASDQFAFKQLNNSLTYTTPDGRVYSGYKYFAIKIVFLSDNTAIAPRVKRLRTISLT